jgi:hypothetical protein
VAAITASTNDPIREASLHATPLGLLLVELLRREGEPRDEKTG